LSVRTGQGANSVIYYLLKQINTKFFLVIQGLLILNKNAPTDQNITLQQKQHNKYQQHENHEAYYLPG